jgi:hypothetical protein
MLSQFDRDLGALPVDLECDLLFSAVVQSLAKVHERVHIAAPRSGPTKRGDISL